MGLLISEIQGRSTYNSAKVYNFYNPNLYWPTNFTPGDLSNYGEALTTPSDGCYYPDCVDYETNVNNNLPCFGDCPDGDCFCIGDPNGDGSLNILDIVSTVNTILGNSSWTSDSQYQAADMNQDGSLNILDVVELVRCTLGVECPDFTRSYVPYGIVDGVGYFNIVNWPHAPQNNVDTINLSGYKVKLVNYDDQNIVDCECEINQNISIETKHVTTIFTDGSLDLECGGYCYYDEQQGFGLRIPSDLQSRQGIIIEDPSGTAISNMNWDLSTMSPFTDVTKCIQNVNSSDVQDCSNFDTISNDVSWPLDVSLAINMEGEGASFNFSDIQLELDTEYPYGWHLACFDYGMKFTVDGIGIPIPYLNDCGSNRPNPSGRTMYGLHRKGCYTSSSGYGYRSINECCSNGDGNCGDLTLYPPLVPPGHPCSFAGYCFDNNDCCPMFINCCDIGIPAESEIIISYTRNGDI